MQLDPMPANGYYKSRTALTGAAQTIALGAAYDNILVWLDSGAAPCNIALAPGVAAAATDPRIEDNMVYKRHLDSDGASNIYLLSAAASGSVNVEAWN